jgi:hypothetical protein
LNESGFVTFGWISLSFVISFGREIVSLYDVEDFIDISDGRLANFDLNFSFTTGLTGCSIMDSGIDFFVFLACFSSSCNALITVKKFEKDVSREQSFGINSVCFDWLFHYKKYYSSCCRIIREERPCWQGFIEETQTNNVTSR